MNISLRGTHFKEPGTSKTHVDHHLMRKDQRKFAKDVKMKNIHSAYTICIRFIYCFCFGRPNSMCSRSVYRLPNQPKIAPDT